MKIDAHQHFWRYDAREYKWIGDGMDVLKRDYMPEDLEPLLREADISGTVAVQARQTLEETEWLLDLADEHAFIKGVVGWVDLCAPDLEMVLERFGPHGNFCGVRHSLQSAAGDRFVLREQEVRGIGMVGEFNLAYDLLIRPHQLDAACELADRYPDQRFVVDHIAKPSIREGTISPWDEGIRRLAEHPHVYCKVSGMTTEADRTSWTMDDFRPYLDIVFDAFGTQRIMLGSDWPVCTLAASYVQVIDLVCEYATQFPVPTQADLCGGNAQRFYRLTR